jgi:membrane fusion protein, heavy metal efflux system
MKRDSRVTLSRSAAAVAAVAILLAGAAASYLLLRSGAGSGDQMAPMTAGATPGEPMQEPAGASPIKGDAPLPDVVVQLSEDAVERAGIVVTPVSRGKSSTALRLPGVVEPNAYRQVAVTPLVAGRITRVSAELGEQVRRGQPMAQIYSPELSEAQTRYVSARAELDAHERELRRTEKLAEIGAASRQELERIHAQHTAQSATVQSARSALELLGGSTAALDNAGPGTGVEATANVPAPLTGVVTERLANVGLNVDSATRLFTVVDLSEVWVIADLYEKDFSRVRVGSDATITTTAYPDLALRARVSYIDPQVRPDTRTAKLRVEVPNPRNELRLGMYADVVVADDNATPVPIIPPSAVQHVGDRTVVYLVNPKEPGKFTEREVRLGPSAGERVEVLSGVQAGDVVVAEGSFFVRAERERLGLRPPILVAGAASADQSKPGGAETRGNVQVAKVVVSEQGYEPAQLKFRAGSPARITLVRTSEKTCGTEVVFPSLNIKRALPLNEAVTIEFTPTKMGDIAFSCGMNMLHGTVVVQ